MALIFIGWPTLAPTGVIEMSNEPTLRSVVALEIAPTEQLLLSLRSAIALPGSMQALYRSPSTRVTGPDSRLNPSCAFKATLTLLISEAAPL
jgi:hypothetical protein